MFNSLIQWDIFQKILLNTLFVSIPEELYLVMFTFILMGEFDFWKESGYGKPFDRWDFIRVFTPTLIGAVLSNTLRYSGVSYTIIFPVFISTIFIIIVLMGDLWGDAKILNWIGRAFLCLMVGIITMTVAEFIYTPFIVYGTGRTIPEINNTIVLNAMFSFPSRVIEYSILVFLIIKKRSILRTGIIKFILNNRILLTITLIIVLFDVIFMFSMIKVVIYDKILINTNSFLQLLIIISTFIFPILNISALIWGIYYVKEKETCKQKNMSSQIKKLTEEIKVYTDNEKYDNIKWKIHEIEKIADVLSEEI